MKLSEPPIGIIVTLPERFFKEQSYREYMKELMLMNEDQTAIWIRIMKNLPIQDFLYVYTLINGKIKHRTNFAGIERNKRYEFSRPYGGVKVFENANAILMSGPVVMAPKTIWMQGFQGFRYVTEILF